MSGEGPESIPTSADARSKRPTKKRALTPTTQQAQTVDALFAKPDQDIRIPTAAGSDGAGGRPARAPPEIVTNVQGSSAGAGSGEFHVYKASRRREYDRLRRLDEELRREKGTEEFERTKAERDARDDEKTKRNREKREKMKARKAKAAKVKAAGGDGGAAGAGQAGAGPGGASGGVKPRNLAATKAGDAEMEEAGDGRGDGVDTVMSASEPAGLVIHDDD